MPEAKSWLARDVPTCSFQYVISNLCWFHCMLCNLWNSYACCAGEPHLWTAMKSFRVWIHYVHLWKQITLMPARNYNYKSVNISHHNDGFSWIAQFLKTPVMRCCGFFFVLLIIFVAYFHPPWLQNSLEALKLLWGASIHCASALCECWKVMNLGNQERHTLEVNYAIWKFINFNLWRGWISDTYLQVFH